MNAAPQKIVSVVTGAGRGLGRQVALALAERGDAVALLARNREQLDETQALIQATRGLARAFPVDVSDPDEVSGVAQAITREFGAVSVTCRAFLSQMLRQGWGRIINVSSAAAFHPPGPLNSAYGTSKVALNQFTRHLAAEIAGTGVTANAIHPGEVKTDMWADIRDQAASLGPEGDGYRRWVKWVGETGGDDPAKAADLVVKLTGLASANINGQFLWIEGGLQTPIPSW
jgi:NAD(P)-dependent dehydrogenase (short-subunit alcohol dehydrogenase family)